ncbi:MAG: hypothetical protein AAF657_23805 [Acidobacteriota bacterium]
MENFAAVLRTLLARIRAFEAARAGRDWPPSGDAATAHDTLYRVPATSWGLSELDSAEPASTTDRMKTAEGAPSEPGDRVNRRGLELTVYGLPVPRGLPST